MRDARIVCRRMHSGGGVVCWRSTCALSDGKLKPHGSALSRFADDFDFATVAFQHAVNHGEAEPAAVFALGRKEGLQAAPAGLLVHADARVAHFDARAIAERAGLQGDGAALTASRPRR